MCTAFWRIDLLLLQLISYSVCLSTLGGSWENNSDVLPKVLDYWVLLDVSKVSIHQTAMDRNVVQADLLDNGNQLVKPGGLLVYSTCSIEADENEEQIMAFLDRHPNFQLDTPPASIPSDVLQNGCLRTLPHVHGIDGAFAARLRRTA